MKFELTEKHKEYLTILFPFFLIAIIFIIPFSIIVVFELIKEDKSNWTKFDISSEDLSQKNQIIKDISTCRSYINHNIAGKWVTGPGDSTNYPYIELRPNRTINYWVYDTVGEKEIHIYKGKWKLDINNSKLIVNISEFLTQSDYYDTTKSDIEYEIEYYYFDYENRQVDCLDEYSNIVIPGTVLYKEDSYQYID